MRSIKNSSVSLIWKFEFLNWRIRNLNIHDELKLISFNHQVDSILKIPNFDALWSLFENSKFWIGAIKTWTKNEIVCAYLQHISFNETKFEWNRPTRCSRKPIWNFEFLNWRHKNLNDSGELKMTFSESSSPPDSKNTQFDALRSLFRNLNFWIGAKKTWTLNEIAHARLEHISCTETKFQRNRQVRDLRADSDRQTNRQTHTQ